MKLFARKQEEQQATSGTPAKETAAPPRPPQQKSRLTTAERARQDLKLKIHRDLLQRLDLNNLVHLDPAEANAEVRQVILQLIGEQPIPLSLRDRQQLCDEIHAEVYGLGPIEPLMRDPDITDILVNGSRQVYVERFGKLEMTPVIFRDDDHLLQIIDRIVSSIGRRVDESSPMVDARLPDGSRVNAIIPPLALDGPAMSIRRFGLKPLGIEDLMRHGALTQGMIDVLRAMVLARLNILVIGGTGSGKTTMLNSLSSFIPETEPLRTRSSIVSGVRPKRRIDMIGPSSASGGMIALTREPSGSRASTIGELSSTRRPTRDTMRSMICIRCWLSRKITFVVSSFPWRSM
jgi:hypothetical protein